MGYCPVREVSEHRSERFSSTSSDDEIDEKISIFQEGPRKDDRFD
jgi:hypothetical protein